MHISVVIPTRNRPDLIGQCVESVLANKYASFDVVVVDQSDDAATEAVVRRLMLDSPNLSYRHLLQPGAARARNAGARCTRGEVIAYTDDDCVVSPDWLAQMAAAFQSAPDAEILYGQVLLPHALRAVASEVPVLLFSRARTISRATGFELFGMSANMGVRRRLFDRIEGFDEVLGVGGPLWSGEDFDFHYRAVYLAGATALLRPEVTVDHYGARNPDQWPLTLRRYGLGDGAFYFKHVRCGDLYAARLLVERVLRLAIRETLSATGLRRRPSHAVYLRSCLEGIVQSWKFRVNRSARMYHSAPVAV